MVAGTEKRPLFRLDTSTFLSLLKLFLYEKSIKDSSKKTAEICHCETRSKATERWLDWHSGFH
jgi:hypothetical protein